MASGGLDATTCSRNRHDPRWPLEKNASHELPLGLALTIHRFHSINDLPALHSVQAPFDS